MKRISLIALLIIASGALFLLLNSRPPSEQSPAPIRPAHPVPPEPAQEPPSSPPRISEPSTAPPPESAPQQSPSLTEEERLEQLKLRDFEGYLREQSRKSGVSRETNDELRKDPAKREAFAREKVLPRLEERMKRLESEVPEPAPLEKPRE